jgi:hypothetical protein
VAPELSNTVPVITAVGVWAYDKTQDPRHSKIDIRVDFFAKRIDSSSQMKQACRATGPKSMSNREGLRSAKTYQS